MDEYKTCCFFGHREIDVDSALREKLKALVEKLIVEEKFSVFCFGGFGKFDELAWEVVSELKKAHTHIIRRFYLYDPRHERESKRPYYMNKENYEEFVYPNLAFDWWYKRIYYRNVEIINQSDVCIFYVRNTENSGAYKAYKYALSKKKRCINVAE